MKVYLSYASKDCDLARDVSAALVEAGYEAWSPERLLPGDNWGRKVARALDRSEAMVAFVSPDWTSSH